MQRPNDVDELFDVKNYYYIGNYQHCINEALKIKTPSVEKDMFMYRSYIAQRKYRVVLDEIKANNSTALLPVRFIAEYLSQPDKRDGIIQSLDDKVAKDLGNLDEIWIIAAATVYYNAGLYECALRILHEVNNLECMALVLQNLIKLNRLDLAKKAFASMQEKDDDATLTQLAQAWLNIEIGGEKFQDAYYIFQEFADKFSPTVLLLNGQAVCFIGQQKYEEAESALRDALDKDANNYDTLMNLVSLSEHTEKSSDVAQRYLTQLMDSHRSSAFVEEYIRKENEFDRLCLEYTPTKVDSGEIIVFG